jgi:hypothetical protein
MTDEAAGNAPVITLGRVTRSPGNSNRLDESEVFAVVSYTTHLGAAWRASSADCEA